MRFLITIAVLVVSTPAYAFTSRDCGVTDKPGSRALVRYCAQLRQHAIKSEPAYELSGVIERADPIEGEPRSVHYFWIKSASGEILYFDGVSDIGRRILKACEVSQYCVVKVVAEKSWEHNLGHATFWIAKLDGDPKPSVHQMNVVQTCTGKVTHKRSDWYEIGGCVFLFSSIAGARILGFCGLFDHVCEVEAKGELKADFYIEEVISIRSDSGATHTWSK